MEQTWLFLSASAFGPKPFRRDVMDCHRGRDTQLQYSKVFLGDDAAECCDAGCLRFINQLPDSYLLFFFLHSHLPLFFREDFKNLGKGRIDFADLSPTRRNRVPNPKWRPSRVSTRRTQTWEVHCTPTLGLFPSTQIFAYITCADF